MQLSELRDWVRQQAVYSTDDWADSKINAVINQGMREISSRFPWPFLAASTTLVTVAATQSYALPTDWLRTAALIEQGGNRMVEVAAHTAWEARGDDLQTGQPSSFFIWGNTLYFTKIPDSALTYDHHYYREITTLTNDTDEPEFAEPFHVAVAHYGLARVWEREEDYSRRDEHDRAFANEVERMAVHYLNRAEDGPMVFGEWPTRRVKGTNLPWLDDAGIL